MFRTSFTFAFSQTRVRLLGMNDAWSPSQYNRFKNERSAPFYDLLSLVQGSGFQEAVDLGCGSGELTYELHERLKCKHTVGFDSSDSMLEKAKPHTSTTLEFHKRRIEDFPTDPKRNLIFSNAALQWCSDHVTLLKKFYDSLQTDGQLAIQVPANQDYPTHVIANQLAREEPFRSAFQQKEKPPGVLTSEEYARHLHLLGFKEQHVRLQVYPHVLKNRDEVIEWVKGTLLTFFQSKLTPDQYTVFLNEFRSRLFQVLPDDKPFFYPFKRILLWAKK